MHDPYWREACEIVWPILRSDDLVLAPRGDWPAWPCRALFYDAVIEPEDATVLFLHKGRLAGLAKLALAGMLASWRVIYAGAVFVVLGRGRHLVGEPAWRNLLSHYRPLTPLRRYLSVCPKTS